MFYQKKITSHCALRSAQKKEQASEAQTNNILLKSVGDVIPETSPLSIFLSQVWIEQDGQVPQGRSLRLFAKMCHIEGATGDSVFNAHQRESEFSFLYSI